MSMLFGSLYVSPPSFSHDLWMLDKKDIAVIGQTPCSRPHSANSADSVSSNYATPETGHHADERIHQHQITFQLYDKSAQNVVSASTGHKATKDPRRPSSSLHDSGEAKQSSLVPQGDYRPPLAVDHYSPTWSISETRVQPRIGSKAPTANTIWPEISHIQKPSLSPVKNRWQKRIAETTSPVWEIDRSKRPKKQKPVRRSGGSGRLTPPPMHEMVVHGSRKSRRSFDAEEIPEVPDSSLERSGSAFSSDVESRVAFRQQVSDALLGKSDLNWSDIGLVSGSGYQVREEEL